MKKETNLNYYQQRKARAHDEAVDWQHSIEEDDFEFFEKQEYFEKLAKRYGLVKEFKENGII